METATSQFVWATWKYILQNSFCNLFCFKSLGSVKHGSLDWQRISYRLSYKAQKMFFVAGVNNHKADVQNKRKATEESPTTFAEGLM